jgi:DNA repair protein RadD
MKLELRPLQKTVIDRVSEAFRAGHKRVMVCAPCGFGKTEIATAMLEATYARGKRGAFIADRISLITQTSERFDKYELPHGIIQADHWRFRPSEPIQVCSIKTILKRRWPEVNLMMIDEAHELAQAVREKLEQKDCYSIGLSATPVTPGLAKYFDVVINATTTNELIDLGLLVPMRVYSYDAPDMSGVSTTSTGEWNDKEGEERVLAVVGDVVAHYLEHGNNRKFVCFAWNIAHARELQRQFVAAGVNASTYTADDRVEDRHEDVQEFKKHNSTIRGLISVKALTRGFDCTDVEILIDAHPIRKAWWDYVQMLGRVMRSHEGKTGCTVFDHSGNYLAFNHLVEDLFANGVKELDDGKRKPKGEAAPKEETQPIRCPKCKVMHKPVPICPACGFEYPKRAAMVEHVPGTLKELVATKNQNMMRKHLWPMVVGYALQTTDDMAVVQRKAQAIYHELTGEFAKARAESTTPAEPSRELLNKIKANRIRWAKGRAKSASASAQVAA